MKHGKKYVASAGLVDSTKQYDIAEAMELTVKTKTAKFDETVEAHISRSAAPSFFPTEPVKKFACLFSAKRTRQRLLLTQVPIM